MMFIIATNSEVHHYLPPTKHMHTFPTYQADTSFVVATYQGHAPYVAATYQADTLFVVAVPTRDTHSEWLSLTTTTTHHLHHISFVKSCTKFEAEHTLASVADFAICNDL